jgi:hypothetical protein
MAREAQAQLAGPLTPQSAHRRSRTTGYTWERRNTGCLIGMHPASGFSGYRH